MLGTPHAGRGRLELSGLQLWLTHRQPLPQQPHQGKSRVSAILFASFFSLFVLFVLFDRLRELLFSELSGSSPDSFTESSLDDLIRLDLLELECDLSFLWRWSPLFLDFLVAVPGSTRLFSSSPRKLPFRRIPFTVFDVETCLFWASSAELPAVKFPPFGSSNTTDARFILLLGSFDAESESEPPPILSAELTDKLDSVLCMLLFWIAYFRSEDALGDSLLVFLRVLLVPIEGSSIEELLGRAIFDKPSIPFPLPMHRALPFPVTA